jgi:hypothetical protein
VLAVVNSPLVFFALALLIVEAFIGVVAVGLPADQKLIGVTIGATLFLVVIGVMTYLVVKYPENLVFRESTYLEKYRLLPQSSVESIRNVVVRDEGEGGEETAVDTTQTEGALESAQIGATQTDPKPSNDAHGVHAQPSEIAWFRVYLEQKAIEKLQTMLRPEWRVVPQQKYVFPDGTQIAVDGVIQGPEPYPDVIVEVKDLTTSLIKPDRILAYATRADDLASGVSRRTGERYARLLILLVKDRDQAIAKAMEQKLGTLVTGPDKYTAHYAHDAGWMEFWGDTSSVPFLRPWAARK